VRRHLHAAEVARGDVDVEPSAEILVKRLGAVGFRNAEHYDFELHVAWHFFLLGHCGFCFQDLELPLWSQRHWHEPLGSTTYR